MNTHNLSEQDLAFRAAFKTFAIEPAGFDHRAHVRLAYAYLAGSEVEQACMEMRGSLLAFLTHNNVPTSKFHETLTRAWILAVRHFMDKSSTSSFDDFIGRNPALLDSKIMLTHYSAAHLFSENARGQFVEPDIDAIPNSGAHEQRAAT
jgi:hypothetical protein